MTMPANPVPVDFCAWTAALYDPCSHRCVPGLLNGYASDTGMTFDPTIEYTGGDEQTKSNGCYKPIIQRTTPQRLKWAKGDMEVANGHPEFDALYERTQLYVPASGPYSAKTQGGAIGNEKLPDLFFFMVLYMGLYYDENGCGTSPVTLSGSTTTSADATVTVSSTALLAAGMPVSGPGIPLGTTVLSVTNGTTLELSVNATASSSAAATLVFTPIANAARALIMPKVRITRMGAGLKEGPHDFKYTLTAYPDHPAASYTGPNAEIPATFFTQVTTKTWGYWLDVTDVPAVDSGILIPAA